ncbi:MAG: MASE1 domain-containing protein, partial [Bdellovibrionales bacterium]
MTQPRKFRIDQSLAAKILFLSIVYFLTARVGLSLEAVSGFASLVWPPTGIAIATLSLYGYRLWPGIALGAFAVNFVVGAPFFVALGIASGNTLEAVSCVYLLQRFRFDHRLKRRSDVVKLAGAATVGAAISGNMGVLSLWLGGVIFTSDIHQTWLAWWLGDSMGALVVAPLLFLYRGIGPFPKLRWVSVLELTSLSLSTLVVGAWIFFDLSYPDSTLFRQSYFVFPILLWAASRFGPRAAVGTTFVISCLAVAGTVVGRGPFTEYDPSENLFHLQIFLAVVALTSLILAAAVEEGKRERKRQRSASRRLSAQYKVMTALADARKKSEEELRNALRARDQFLSMASHELRTPMTSLRLQTQIIGRAVARDGPKVFTRERMEQFVTQTERQVDRLAKLVDDMMDISRIRSGRLALQIESVDLRELIEEVVGRHFLHLKEGVEGTAQVFWGEPVYGQWDRFRLEQVMSNLVTNAIRYGQGKPIEIRTERWGETVRIHVRDYGMGIEKKDQERIFDRFERAVSANEISGLGLGLFICKQIV